MKIYAFIPARAGSKSIPLKNIKPICGKPLLQWSIDAANACELIDEVVVSTDSGNISSAVSGAKIISRSKESATDEASSEIPLLEFASKVSTEDLIVFIQATSPLTTSEELSRGIRSVLSDSCDTCLSVVRQKRFIWDAEGKPDYNLGARPRRQEWSGFHVETGAFYISPAGRIMDSKCRISGRVEKVECDPKTYYEIDEPDDWVIIETFLKQKHEYNNI